MNKKRLFITGTMRTGGSLLINLLSVHSKVVIFNEIIHFYRFIYNRYNPLNLKSLDHLLNEQRLRLKYRMNITLDVSYLKSKILQKKISYKNIYEEFLDYFIKVSKKKIGGEYAALQWREIPEFINKFKSGKVIQIYRDPRAVLASWKKLSSIPNYAYLNAVFNWVDSIQHVQKYKKKYNKKNYLPVKYEDIMVDPTKLVKELTDFLKIKNEKSLLEPNKWKKKFDSKIVHVPRSAHEGKNILGFSKKRISNWKKNLKNWEIYFIEKICSDLMKKYGYTLSNFNRHQKKIFKKKINKILLKNNLLRKNYKNFVNKNIGINQYPTDPTDPRSWGSPEDASKWFVETDLSKEYFQELAISSKKINEKYI